MMSHASFAFFCGKSERLVLVLGPGGWSQPVFEFHCVLCVNLRLAAVAVYMYVYVYYTYTITHAPRAPHGPAAPPRARACLLYLYCYCTALHLHMCSPAPSACAGNRGLTRPRRTPRRAASRPTTDYSATATAII